jgi:hypothetical protein
VSATLRWTDRNDDLDLTLFRQGENSVPIVSSRGVSQPERIDSVVEGEDVYELRVTYSDGDTIANFTLTYSHPS